MPGVKPVIMKNFYTFFPIVFVCFILLLLSPRHTFSQGRIKNYPGYERFSGISPKIRGSFKTGALTVAWSENGKSFSYTKEGKKYQFDVKEKTVTETGEAGAEDSPMRRFMGGNRPERGRQFTEAESPDKTKKAVYRDRNLYLVDTETKKETAVTTDGNEKDRLKFGTASWVYGEELNQITAMWWSPDSKKIAFYCFDEANVRDYYLQYKQTELYDSVEIEPYTKVGAVNPKVDILIYALETGRTITVDSRDGKPFDDSVVGHYLYDIEWSPNGQELLFHRTNRKQDVMEWVAAEPGTGKTRVIVREEWPASFTENSPEARFLSDKTRFIWNSERNGFKNYYLYNLDGKLLATLTNHLFEVSGIVSVDEKNGFLYYMARSGDNHQKEQLHRVGLDGKNDVRLTNPVFNHTVSVSPGGKYFVDVAQTHDTPPFTNLLDSKGKVVAELAKSDLTEFEKLGLKKVEAFTFTSADGRTQLHGVLHFPSNFDPSKKYPMLVSMYGGPQTNSFTENFTLPNSLTEYGFLVASVDGRNAAGRGKKFLDALYGNLGMVEMADFAEGIKSLYGRPYFDKNRVGIFGTSFGGTTAAICLLKYPEVFQAAVACSGVTDWRNYDNIYTERFMNLYENNREGYENGEVMKYASNLKGNLMIYYGSSDNNVHPSNSMQLIKALQKAGKSFEVQVGPDLGHTAANRDRMMEFFIENLVLK